jgi:cytochrome P450
VRSGICKLAANKIGENLDMDLNLKIEGERVKLNPRDPHFYNNPYPYYEALREAATPFFWEDFDIWCFVNHKDVDALLRDRRFGRQITHIKTREELGWQPIPDELKPFYDIDDKSMIQLEPPAHTRLRGLVQKAFMARQIENMRPRLETLCDSLIDAMLEQRRFDLLPAFATPIPVIAIADMLGVPREMKEHLLNWSHAMVSMYVLGRTKKQEHEAVQATQEFVSYLRDLVKARRRHPREDLLSLLIAAEEQGDKLSEDELIGSAIQLLNAGHEATVNVIGNGVYQLMLHRDQWKRLVAEPALVKTAIEELMRFDSPLHLFKRWALEDLDYNGKRFKFGDEIAVLLGAANRDSARFAHAETLDITRADNPHVSFGGGIHFCVGAPLARLELHIALERLTRRLPTLELTETPTYRNAFAFHGLMSLNMQCV